MNSGLGVLEIVAEMFGKSLDSRLGRVVCGITGRISDALLGTGNDDSRRLLL